MRRVLENNELFDEVFGYANILEGITRINQLMDEPYVTLDVLLKTDDDGPEQNVANAKRLVDVLEQSTLSLRFDLYLVMIVEFQDKETKKQVNEWIHNSFVKKVIDFPFTSWTV